MRVDPALPVQRAIYALLTARLPLNAGQLVGIYDRIPVDAGYPYLHVGDDQPESAGIGDYVRSCVHVWSRQVGHTEAKAIAGQVRFLIDPRDDGSTDLDASAEGVSIGFASWLRTRILDDPDGITVHAVVEFKIGADPLP